MLKALFTLDCDECHEPLTRAAVVREQNEDLITHTWQEAAHILMSWAADDGWEFYRLFHTCPACLLENYKMESVMHDEEFSSTT